MNTILQDHVVCTDNACSANITIEEALRIGSAELAASSIDVDTIAKSARGYFARVESFPMPDAVAHLYRKAGMDGDLAERTFATIARCLALFSAWHDHRPEGGFLSLPDHLDLVGWHGFIIQTRLYDEFAELLDYFVHHETTAGGQNVPNLLTMALFERTFGSLDQEVWQDDVIDGNPIIIYGWCSSGTND